MPKFIKLTDISGKFSRWVNPSTIESIVGQQDNTSAILTVSGDVISTKETPVEILALIEKP